ncbi:hypothetical protein SFMTTN_2861 [Sulfuriferula multivorans]|uniref:Uncharacterized protein n=1 Tax=Sulfuriferula multivorans TaxID=1559896 RepID=A0A401K080_9PROT|nr:hypothetical protein [Sulfuriferula multivorans]GCB02045.1 hypothetical protein SFMTTN_2861 [Sulfuriferula multivorans]
MSNTELHPSIVALVSLAANVAANHPGQGLCQLDKLKQYGVSAEQIDLVVDIARHIRDEAGTKLDERFDAELAARTSAVRTPLTIPVVAAACCTPTPSGKSCC